MTLFRAARTVTRKDLRLYFRDRTGMLLGFALPLVLVGVFGFVMKVGFGKEGGLSKATLWVADLDGSAESRAFVAALRRSSTIRLRPEEKEKAETAESVRRKVEEGEAHHALVVEAGFGASLKERRLPRLRMFRDPGREMEDQMIAIGVFQGILSGAGPDLAPLLTARGLQLAGLPEEWSERILAVSRTFSTAVEGLFREAEKRWRAEPETKPGPAGAEGPDFAAVIGNLFPMERVDLAPPARPRQLTYMLAQSVSGIGIMMLMFGLVAAGTMLLKEREEGTLERLLVAPAPRDALFLGKFLFMLLIGALQLVILFGFGRFVFQVDVLARPVTMLIVSFTVLVATTAFGLIVAAWARTTKQAEGLSTLVILVMSALGGAWFPIQMLDLPLAARIVTRSTLTHWAMSAYQGLFWHGKAWTERPMLVALGVLWGFALVALALAFRLYRRRFLGR